MPNAHFDTAPARNFCTELWGGTFRSTPQNDYPLMSGEGIAPSTAPSDALTSRDAGALAPGRGPRSAVLVFGVADMDKSHAVALTSSGAEAMLPQPPETM